MFDEKEYLWEGNTQRERQWLDVIRRQTESESSVRFAAYMLSDDAKHRQAAVKDNPYAYGDCGLYLDELTEYADGYGLTAGAIYEEFGVPPTCSKASCDRAGATIVGKWLREMSHIFADRINWKRTRQGAEYTFSWASAQPEKV